MTYRRISANKFECLDTKSLKHWIRGRKELEGIIFTTPFFKKMEMKTRKKKPIGKQRRITCIKSVLMLFQIEHGDLIPLIGFVVHLRASTAGLSNPRPAAHMWPTRQFCAAREIKCFHKIC